MVQPADIFTFSIEETGHRLRESFRTLEWAVAMLPKGLHHVVPEPRALFEAGSWTAAMNLAHLTIYEERLALPVMEALAAGGDGTGVVPSYGENWLENDALPLSVEPVMALMGRLRAARERQIALATCFAEARFNTPIIAGWSGRAGTALKSPGWVLNKTFQHTWEHGNALLRVALFGVR